MTEPIKTAPKDGTPIWLYSKTEWTGARLGYWLRDTRASGWKSVFDLGWINGATHWEPAVAETQDVTNKDLTND